MGAEERGEKLAARARERAAASDRAAEGFRDEMRRSVGAERQRVAGMLYKEALQTQTVEDLQRQVRACVCVCSTSSAAFSAFTLSRLLVRCL